MTFRDATVLITGGTGSFGRAFIELALRELGPKKLIVFSRDELKQHEMREGGLGNPRLRWFIGDVRDLERLRRAMDGVDVVIHAAALKQVPACEYNPSEAVKTNVGGSQNVIDAAIDRGVGRVVALSSDKAVSPVNLYGATKLCAEKLFVQGNAYAGGKATRFACCRYGNVVGSRGSVVPTFLKQRTTGRVTITDERMTRFWLTLDESVRFVVRAIERMQGGEVFVPKLPSMRITDLAAVLAPGCRVEVVGIRPGEKLHESLISADEARSAVALGDSFIIEPLHPWWNAPAHGGTRVADGFEYRSDKNDRWLAAADLARMLSA